MTTISLGKMEAPAARQRQPDALGFGPKEDGAGDLSADDADEETGKKKLVAW